MKHMRLRWRLRRHPKDAQTWCTLAAALLTDGDIKAARAAAEQGARHVTCVDDALAASDALQQCGRLDRTLSVLSQGCRTAPEDPRIHAALGRFAMRIRRYETARVALAQACALLPDDRVLARLHGQALLADGDADGACAVLQIAADRAPDDLELRLALARAASMAGHSALAIECLRRAAAQAPEQLEIQLKLAAGLARHAGPADALRLLSDLRSRWPDSPEVLLNTASALAALDRVDEALTLLETVRQLRPDQPIIDRNRGSILFGAARYEEALTVFEGLTRRLPENAEAHLLLATTLSRLQRDDEALSSAKRAMRLAGEGSVRDRAHHLLDRLRTASKSEGTGPVDDGSVILSGTLERVPVTQLLEFMRTNAVTGRLILSAQQGVARLTVVDGLLTAAGCSNRPNLGDRLVEHGWLSRATLDTRPAHTAGPVSDVLLGTQLRDAGLITTEQLKQVIEEQVIAALTTLVQWSKGTFKLFDAAADVAPVKLRIDYVLLDVMRMLDEANAEQR